MQTGKTIPSISLCCGDFSARDTLSSGQCFRWSERDGRMCGTAMGRYVEIAQKGDIVTIYGADSGDEALWRRYLDLDRDYAAIRALVVQTEPRLREAAAFAGGIHILAQEPWEALCSFLISQNNHIPRIRGIIRRLCVTCGQPAAGWEYAAGAGAEPTADAMCFPIPEEMAGLTEKDWKAMGCGYRAGYLAELVRETVAGRFRVEDLCGVSTNDARRELLKRKGVGPKVAECVLLYGLGRMECFPIDVWVGRGLQGEFAGMEALRRSEYAGVAQQYIFEYMRLRKER